MTVDLRSAPVADLATTDFRDPERDPWADEAALWGRLQAALDAVPLVRWGDVISGSDGGGPDWTIRDHVGHLADWSDEAIGYISRVLDGDAWPREADFAGGDFDSFNEARRPTWAGDDAAEVRLHLTESRERLVALARSLPAGVVHSDEAWTWIFMTLHGHVLEHLAILERAPSGAAAAR